MNRTTLGPVQDRLDHLDVLRGFALLGILVVNFAYFSRPIQSIALGPDLSLDGLDRLVDWLIRSLFEGKFIALFSILFGAGFALMMRRSAERSAPFWGLYLRRLLGLGVFGLAHVLLVWSGDILLIYALCALLMIACFRRTPTQRLWKWAMVFLTIPPAIMGLLALAIQFLAASPEAQAALNAGFEGAQQELLADVEQAAAILATGSWLDNVAQRQRDLVFLLSSFVFWVPGIIGYFLIGRWLLETGRLLHPDQHRLFFQRWRWRGLVLGLPLAVLGTALTQLAGSLIVPTPLLVASMTVAALAAVLLALGYLSTIMLGWTRLRLLAPAGQMALSNYLLQSLVWTWVFYGHGLGLWNSLPRSAHLVLALTFFGLQVAFSHWWMGRYRFGPAEWLWRSLSYASPQAMRRSTSV